MRQNLAHSLQIHILPQSNDMSAVINHAPTFELAPAERKDIPRLAYIHVVACLPDNAFGLYFATAREFEQQVTEMLKDQVGDSTWQHVKAVDKKTGVLAAWASWNTPSDDQIRERDKKAMAKIVDHKKGMSKGEFDFPPGLPLYVREDTDRWLEKWTQGQRHILCKALFTEPSFQHQGMGNALVKYGNRLADQATLPIFLQGSPLGYPIYAKHGFETVQYLDVDLRKWGPDAKRNDKGYGNYRFRYMVRLPRTLPEIS
jgi:Acetyltransferase (GNAT) domain